MKKSIKIICFILSLAIICITLASCGKSLSGTYTGEIGSLGTIGGKMTYVFSGSKVTIKLSAGVFGITANKEFEGTYKLIDNDDGTRSIEFVFGSDALDYAGTFDFEEGVEEDGTHTVTIAGLKYFKK